MILTAEVAKTVRERIDQRARGVSLKRVVEEFAAYVRGGNNTLHIADHMQAVSLEKSGVLAAGTAIGLIVIVLLASRVLFLVAVIHQSGAASALEIFLDELLGRLDCDEGKEIYDKVDNEYSERKKLNSRFEDEIGEEGERIEEGKGFLDIKDSAVLSDSLGCGVFNKTRPRAIYDEDACAEAYESCRGIEDRAALLEKSRTADKCGEIEAEDSERDRGNESDDRGIFDPERGKQIRHNASRVAQKNDDKYDEDRYDYEKSEHLAVQLCTSEADKSCYCRDDGKEYGAEQSPQRIAHYQRKKVEAHYISP